MTDLRSRLAEEDITSSFQNASIVFESLSGRVVEKQLGSLQNRMLHEKGRATKSWPMVTFHLYVYRWTRARFGPSVHESVSSGLGKWQQRF